VEHNARTTIDLPVSGCVEMAVYDLLGRKVRSLVSQDLIAGQHTRSFEARTMASGTEVILLAGETVSLFHRLQLLT
jgi:hypothetical protein